MIKKIFFLLIILCFNLNSENLVVPQELQEWTEWIKSKHPEWNCPKNKTSRQCFWLGKLEYEISKDVTQFKFKVSAFNQSTIQLPGYSDRHVPKNIKVIDLKSNQAINPIIYEEATKVYCKLDSGDYLISGEFNWNDQINELPIPVNYALFSVNGINLEQQRVRRIEEKILIEEREIADLNDTINLNVFRKFTDGSPLAIDTLLSLKVSGKARSISFGSLIPINSKVIKIDSELPYQINNQGEIVIQVLPGNYNVLIKSILPQPVNEIILNQSSLDWYPKQEYWGWQADNRYRIIELEGAIPVEANYTEVPEDWKNLAIYATNSGDSIKLKTLRRGLEERENSLSLHRNMFLKLDGSGFITEDSIQGEVNNLTRLNAIEETKIGRVLINNQQVLVSKDPNLKDHGVEIRDKNISLRAISEIDGNNYISATGWKIQVPNSNLSIALPPSWTLLAVKGASSVNGSWLDNWDLFQLFLVIIILITVYKLSDLKSSIIVGLFIILSFNEFIAPKYLLINFFVLLVIHRLLPDSTPTLQKTVKYLLFTTLIVLIIEALTFSKLQFTQMIFPQLQAGTRYRTVLQEILSILETGILSWPKIILAIGIIVYAYNNIKNVIGIFRKLVNLVFWSILFFGFIAITSLSSIFFGHSGHYSSSRQAIGKTFSEADSYISESLERKKVVKSPQSETLSLDLARNTQAGPALPTWRWRNSQITINGLVTGDHKIRLYLLSPNSTRIVCGARALFAILLILLLIKISGIAKAFQYQLLTSSLLLLIIFIPSNLLAEPRADTLQDLENNLIKQQCQENCTNIQNVTISIIDQVLKLRMQVNSIEKNSISLPGPLENIAPNILTNNNQASLALKNNLGYLMVPTNPGSNLIEAEFDIKDRETLDLIFNEQSLSLEVVAPEWTIVGQKPSGASSPSLRFIKNNKKQEVAIEKTETDVNNWGQLTRTIKIGRTVSISSQISHLGETNKNLILDFPIFKNEQVTSKDINVINQKAQAIFKPGVKELFFESNLPLTQELELVAPTSYNLSQKWLIECEQIVNCNITGDSPITNASDNNQSFLIIPNPEEKTIIKINNLNYIEGNYLSIDSIDHQLDLYPTYKQGRVSIKLRATQQGTTWFELPENLSADNTIINGIAGTGIIKANKLFAMVNPGDNQINFQYQDLSPIKIKESLAKINSEEKLTNLTLSIKPNLERWIIWTGGGLWGPSVLIWIKLLMIILIIYSLVAKNLIYLGKINAVILSCGLVFLPIIKLWIPLAWLAVLILNEKDQNIFASKKIKILTLSLITIISLAIFYTLSQNLLNYSPNMLIAGNGSTSSNLIWFFDSVSKQNNSPYVISLPILYFKIFALAWSSWLLIMTMAWLNKTVKQLKY